MANKYIMKKSLIIIGAVLLVLLLGLNWLKLASLSSKEDFRPPTGRQLGKVFFIEAGLKLPQGTEKILVGERSFQGRKLKFYRVNNLVMTVKLSKEESYKISPVLLENNYFGARLKAKKPASQYPKIPSIQLELPNCRTVVFKDTLTGDGRIDLGLIKIINLQQQLLKGIDLKKLPRGEKPAPGFDAKNGMEKPTPAKGTGR